MSKEVDANFLKIQTCVLKVNIHCGGCKQKVKKILHKIDGVYTTTIDAEQGRVTVSGNVHPEALIKKLVKAGKHAELLAPKGGNGINNNKNNNNHHPQQQFQKPQPINTKIHQQKDNGKPQKGGPGGAGHVLGGKDLKGQQPLPSLQQQQQLQQMKGFKDLKLPQLKDMKLPFQDPKTVKFSLPPEDFDDDGSDYDDEFDDDYDDEDFDDMDCFDADFDEDFKNLKIKNMNAPPPGHGKMADQKGVGGPNAKKGGPGANLPPQNKGMGGANEAKNGNAGGKKGGGGAAAGGGNQSQGGGKNGGGPMDIKNGNKAAPNGHGGMNIQGHGQNHNMNNINVANAANKGGVKSGGHPMMMNPNMMMGQGMQSMNVGQMGSSMQAQMGNFHQGAVQGLPAGAVPPGYFQARMAAPPPEMMAAANPYQQQYMAAMLQQQQQQLQQRMMMMSGQDPALQHQMMMAYPRPPYPAMPPPQGAYIPQMPPQGEPYTNFFSDENTSSCSIM